VTRRDRVVTPALAALQDFLSKKGATFLPVLASLYPSASSNAGSRPGSSPKRISPG
jgi:hypothetical protein